MQLDRPLLMALALVACNQPPGTPSVSVVPAVPTTADELVATYDEIVDPNRRDVVSVEHIWEMVPAGQSEWLARPEFEGARISPDSTAKGQSWRVTVTASDGRETVTSETSTEVVIANSVPQVQQVRLDPAEQVDTQATLTASFDTADLDDDEVTVDLAWFVDGVRIAKSDAELEGEAFSKHDEVWVEATPADDEVTGATVASNRVTILNTVPSVTGVVITPAAPMEASLVRCEPVGWQDPDDDPPAIVAAWTVDGVPVDGVTGELTGAHFDRGQILRCEGTPDDGDGQGMPVMSEPVEVVNTPPRIASASLSSSSPMASDVLTVEIVDPVDDDGDPISFRIAWFVDGEQVLVGDELPAASFVKEQQVYAEVTPNDGFEDGTVVRTPVVRAVNSPPEILSLSMGPDPVTTDSVIEYVVDAVDLDGDPISFAHVWTVDGVAVGATGTTLDGEAWFDKEQEVQLELTPNDGAEDGVSVLSDVIEVANSAPLPPTLAMDPKVATPEDDLLCEVTSVATDADDDTLTYTFTWTRNGSAFTDTTTVDYDDDAVSADYTADRDRFECTVEVSDGTDSSTASVEGEVSDWGGTRDFSNCSATGYEGPTQSACDTAYTGTSLDGEVTIVDGGWQEWTVPTDATYRIEAYGAQGGAGKTGTKTGYAGARVRGDFDLEAGDELLVLVAQQGSTGTGTYAAGGGGASWVMMADGTPLLAAAGGGSNAYNLNKPADCEGQAGIRPGSRLGVSTDPCGTSYSATGYGGTYYIGTIASARHYFGGGGGGYKGNGSDYSSTCALDAYAANHVRYPARGARAYNGSHGGFGGGGCGGTNRVVLSSITYVTDWGSGGGGGYTGGGAGRYHGGGGASYNSGSNTSNTSGARTGHGRVVIDLAP